MVIKSLELENVGPFRFRAAAVPKTNDFKVRIEFDTDVNLFIGPNNVGKSTILQAVRLLTERWTADLSEHYTSSIGFPREANFATVAIEWNDVQRQNSRFEANYGDLQRILDAIRKQAMYDRQGAAHRQEMGMPSITRPAADAGVTNERVGSIQFLDTATSSANCSYAEWENHKSKVFGYVGYATHTSYRLQNPASLIAYSQGRNEFDRDVYFTISRIVAQIMQGFPMQISADNFRGGTINVQTSDGQVPFEDISLGTRYALAWVIQFVDSFAQRFEGDAGWREKQGSLIIDEVDAHLHPSWQRRIVPTLKEYFPNVQIFASTHSPMMVAGLKAGQVHLLKRDETGRVVWSRNEQDIIGWTADEIYRTFMGIDDPTDELTVQRANRLRELRDKIPRTEAEEEELQNLRRQVNQDLLAGGRINAQRERFDAIMQEYLRSRMSDLSQDGA